MADNPFDHTNYGLREKPVSADWNQLSSQLYMTIREVHRYLHQVRVSDSSSAAQSVSGFHGAGLRVVPSSPAGMSVVVSPGLGFLYAPTDIPTNLGATDMESVDDRSPYKPLLVQSPLTFTVPTAPAAPNSRIDIIEVRNPRRLENAISRRQLDPNTLSYEDHIFNKTLAYQIDANQQGTVNDPAGSTAALSYKVGTAANPGLMPPTSPDYIKIAEIYVTNGVTSIDVDKLADQRPLLAPGGAIRATIRFRLQWNGGAPTATILDLDAPPGVDILILPTTPIGTATLGIIAGSISHATVVYQSVDFASTAKILALQDPAGPTSGGIAAAPNAIASAGFSRPSTQSGAITGVIHGLITPGSPANIDFGAAGLGDLICTADFSLRA